MSSFDDSRAPPPPAPTDERDDRDERANSRGPPPPVRSAHAPAVTTPSNVLGVFGLSVRTVERDLDHEFGRFGVVEKVVVVYDQRSERSRGFGFVTMSSVEEAEKCIKELNGMDLHGRRIRVDFSATTRPHQPTPGEYRGVKRDDEFSRGPPRTGYGDRWASSASSYGRRDDRYGGGGYRDRDDRYGGREDPYRRDSYYDRERSGGRARSPPRRDRSASPNRRDRDPYHSRSAAPVADAELGSVPPPRESRW